MGGSVFIGRVVSNRMQKTVVVAVSYVVWVPKYKVYEKRVSRHMAHDEKQECVVGDLVKINVTRKLSKHKSYKVTSILKRTPVLTPSAASAAVAGGTPPGAVEAAMARVDAARERLEAVRKMYEKELGAVPGILSSAPASAVPSPSKPQTPSPPAGQDSSEQGFVSASHGTQGAGSSSALQGDGGAAVSAAAQGLGVGRSVGGANDKQGGSSGQQAGNRVAGQAGAMQTSSPDGLGQEDKA